jgi:hypothetical protein
VLDDGLLALHELELPWVRTGVGVTLGLVGAAGSGVLDRDDAVRDQGWDPAADRRPVRDDVADAELGDPVMT